MSKRLSDYFTLREMTKSQTATRYGIDNTPTEDHIANLTRLCEKILDEIRGHYESPVFITSGYRNPELNSRIGGSPTSQHMIGEAADFVVLRVESADVFRWIVSESGLDFDQCIAEFLSEPSGGWIHISYKKNGENRNKITVARKVNGDTVYTHYTKQEILDGDYVL